MAGPCPIREHSFIPRGRRSRLARISRLHRVAARLKAPVPAGGMFLAKPPRKMSEQPYRSSEGRLETFTYDDAIVRKFAFATIVWGLVATLVGLWVALMLVVPSLSFNQPWLTFGRLRPLHTNAAIFAFAGNAIFAAVYYSSQRLLKARMFSDKLSAFHFWGWQAIIVSAALTLPFGITQSKEYAELEWPIDIAIARGLGGVRHQPLRHHRQAPRAPHLRRHLVLHRDGHHRRHPAHLQQPGRSRRDLEELLAVRRRAGRFHAVVVRPQRRRVLPDHAVSGVDVLLPAQGGESAGLLLPAEHLALLVAGLHLHLGRPAPPALHGAARVGLDSWAWSSP